MSRVKWEAVAERVDEHSYMQGTQRTAERVALTAEIFTPTDLVVEMLQRLPIQLLRPGQTVLDPACGDGQFLVAAKWLKVIHFGATEADALGDLYGIDIMRDNVDLCRARLGGATIVMGDALHPSVRLDGQTHDEHQLMKALFAAEATSATRGG